MYLLFRDQHASHPGLKAESTITSGGLTALMISLQLSTTLTYSINDGDQFREPPCINIQIFNVQYSMFKPRKKSDGSYLFHSKLLVGA